MIKQGFGWTVAVACVGGPASIHASSTLWSEPSAVVSIEDANGDGVSEIVVADRYRSGDSKLWLLDGKSGEVLAVAPAREVDGERFGLAMTATDDIDADGVADLAVLAGDSGNGRVVVYSGARLERLHVIDAAKSIGEERWFTSVSRCADFDGDGVGDIAVGSTSLGLGGGAVFVFSAVGAELLLRLAPPSQTLTSFGTAVAALPDIDGGGKGDLAVGATGNKQPGTVFLFSMREMKFSRSVSPEPDPRFNAAKNGFGTRIIGVSDVTGDERADALVINLNDAIYLLDGHTGTIVCQSYFPRTMSGHGASLSALPDVDGDGMADVAVGANEVGSCDRGSVDVFSGADLEVLHRSPIHSTLEGYTCSCESGGIGADVAALGKDVDGQVLLAVASMACGTVAVFEVTDERLRRVWVRSLESQ